MFKSGMVQQISLITFSGSQNYSRYKWIFIETR